MPTAQLQASQAAGARSQAVQRPVKPFCQASKVGTRLVGTYNPGVSATPQAVGPTSLTSSGGFVRRWILETIFSGGGGTTAGVLQADGPWNYFSLVTLSEPNNNPVVNLSGYNLFLADIFGGYATGESPANDPDFSTTLGNINMWPYLPIEIDPTALGALSDLSSSSGYQLYLLPSPLATLFSTLPNPVPSAVVNVYAEYWTLPESVDGQGTQQSIVPPRAGTIQMWNQILNVVLAAGGGNQYMQLNRMGNQIRTLLLVTRAAGARSDVPFPNPARVDWDDIVLHGLSPQVIRKRMFEQVLSQAVRPAGVFMLPFNNGIERNVGGNGASSWLPTVTDTRFALEGNYPAASSPTLDWIINDVSRAPLGAVERTSVGPNSPGYHPVLPTQGQPA